MLGFLLLASSIFATLLRAQDASTSAQAGTNLVTAADVASLPLLSDGQLAVLINELNAIPTLSPDSVTTGTFYSLQNPAWPPMPFNAQGYSIWSLGGGSYLMNDLNGNSSSLAAGQGRARMQTMVTLPSPPGGGGGGYGVDGGGPLYVPPVFTTNELWLQITGVTNPTASLTIHTPWNETNFVYDLLYCTNLVPPVAWQWLRRTDPGQTNLTVSNATDAQGFYGLGSPNDVTAQDSLGTDFWFMFYEMATYGDNDLSVYISSSVTTCGSVIISGFGITNYFTNTAGSVTNISIPLDVMMFDYGPVESYGIHVTADHPVSAYAVNYESAVSTTFNIFPTAFLGTNYCVMAFPSATALAQFSSASEFSIVATEDNTTITITPSTNAAINGSDPYTISNLMQGDSYQMEGGYATNDVTGTWITSDKPIAVFAGASGAFVPAGEPYGNPLVQEQIPINDWGTQALALSFLERTNGDAYRVLAAYSNTVFTIKGMIVTVISNNVSPVVVTTSNEVVTATNQAGQFYDIIVDGPTEFRSSKPIQVAQFATGQAYDKAIYGDPCEILLPPTGHYLTTNIVSSPKHPFATNFLNIIVPQSAIADTLVDGLNVASSNFMEIGTNGFFGARLAVTNGIHTVTSSQPVGVELYGFGDTEYPFSYSDSYSYFGGITK